MKKIKKIEYGELTQALSAVVTAVALILLMFGVVAPDQNPNDATARGITHFDSLTLENDLVVGDDATVTGDLAVTGATTVGTSTMYPLLTDTASQGVYTASSTITGTLTITASTHSLSALTAAFCTLGETPATGAGAGALCWASVSGTTAVVTVEQDDWTTNATVGHVVHYSLVGTP